MAKLIDIDQKVFVTICDETKGGMLYEIQLSIGELLEKSLSDFTPQVVDAIPVEWLKNKMQRPQTTCANPFGFVLAEWLEEQIEYKEAEDDKAD